MAIETLDGGSDLHVRQHRLFRSHAGGQKRSVHDVLINRSTTLSFEVSELPEACEKTNHVLGFVLSSALSLPRVLIDG